MLFPDWVEKRIKIEKDSWTSGNGFYHLCKHLKPTIEKIDVDERSLEKIIPLMEKDFDLPKGFLSETQH